MADAADLVRDSDIHVLTDQHQYCLRELPDGELQLLKCPEPGDDPDLPRVAHLGYEWVVLGVANFLD